MRLCVTMSTFLAEPGADFSVTRARERGRAKFQTGEGDERHPYSQGIFFFFGLSCVED